MEERSNCAAGNSKIKSGKEMTRVRGIFVRTATTYLDANSPETQKSCVLNACFVHLNHDAYLTICT